MKFKEKIGQNKRSRGVMTTALKFKGCRDIFPIKINIYAAVGLSFSAIAMVARD